MRSAIVADGIVTNVIMGEITGSVPCDETVGIGWSWNGATFAAPPAPEPEPVDPISEKDQAEDKLRETDWAIIRAMEKYLIEQKATKDIPEAILTERNAARLKADKTETQK